MTNQFIGIGNLGADPEIRATTNGERVANLRVALTERYQDRQGQQQEKTTWIRVSVFGTQVDRIERAAKGWKCFVMGRLQERTWTDRQGQEHTTAEIVVSAYPHTQIECFPVGQAAGASHGVAAAGQRAGVRAPAPAKSSLHRRGQASTPSFPVADLDDDVPF